MFPNINILFKSIGWHTFDKMRFFRYCESFALNFYLQNKENIFSCIRIRMAD